MNKYAENLDTEIVSLVDDLINNRIQLPIKDLRDLQSELINRRCNSSALAGISTLIMTKMAKGETSDIEPNVKLAGEFAKSESITAPKSAPVAIAAKKNNIETARPIVQDQDDLDEERYPILMFLVSMYKILAWAGLGIIFISAIVYCIYYAQGNINIILCACGIAFLGSAIWLVAFSAMSESMQLKLDMEKNLRELRIYQ